MKEHIAAIVVTYNRLDKLKTTIQKLTEQSSDVDVFIVNNNSTDDTREYCEILEAEGKLTLVNLPKNVGGAGGFADGMDYVMKNHSHEYIWIMDDDTFASPTAAEKLVEPFEYMHQKYGFDVGFTCSKVMWQNGEHEEICEMNAPSCKWDWHRFYESDRPYISIRGTSFVSVMFTRKVIKQYGLPVKDYFIWFDDMEYTLRVAKNTLCLVNLESVVHHDIPENQGVNFSFINEGNIWKYEYGARNETSYHWHRGNKTDVINHIKGIRHGLRSGNVPKKLRNRIYKKILSGFFYNPKHKTY